MSKIFKIVIFIIALLYFGFAFYVIETKAQGSEISIPCIPGPGLACPGTNNYSENESYPFIPGPGVIHPGYEPETIFGLKGQEREGFLQIMYLSIFLSPLFFLIIFIFYIRDEEYKQKKMGISKMVFNLINFISGIIFSGFLFYFYFIIYFEEYINPNSDHSFYLEKIIIFFDELGSFANFLLGIFLSILTTYYIFTLINYIKNKKVASFLIYSMSFIPVFLFFGLILISVLGVL